jgi:hypothetical protein
VIGEFRILDFGLRILGMWIEEFTAENAEDAEVLVGFMILDYGFRVRESRVPGLFHTKHAGGILGFSPFGLGR